MPLKLWIETTARCNLSCALCANRMVANGSKGDMDLLLFRKIIDDAKNFSAEVNLFHRGEPLMNPHIIDMVKYASDNNINTCIHTNATLLDERISASLIKAGLKKISFSLDSCIKQDYEKNRKGADFEETVGNIAGFLKIKKELKSDAPHTVIQLMDPAAKNKCGTSLKKMLKDSYPDKITARNPHNWGGALDTGTKKGFSPAGKHMAQCTFPWYSLTVFYDGTVYPCPQDFNGRIQLGDLKKQSFSDIFNSKTLKKLRIKFRKRDVSGLQPCSSCDRISRRTFLGVPSEYLGDFAGNIFKK